MAIQRADTLYPDNGTTVDTGTGIDIRWLDSATGAVDETQSVRWTHTQDGQHRTFDPATATVTTAADPHTLQMEGYALRLTEDMTPGDDTNCNAMLTATTVTVTCDVRLNASGGTNLGGVNTLAIKASLWSYDPSANTGSVIGTGSTNQTWDTTAVGAENNTYKSTNVSISVASDFEFAQGRILFLQIGATATTLVDATLGTTDYDLTLRLGGTANTKVAFGTGKGIRQLCRFTNNLNGRGTIPRPPLVVALLRSNSARGTVTPTKVVVASKTFSLNGRGTVAHTKAAALPRNIVGRGTVTMQRVVVASKTFNLATRATINAPLRVLAIARSIAARGTTTYTKGVVASKTFSLNAVGVPTHTKFTQVFRTFNLRAHGNISAPHRALTIVKSLNAFSVVAYTRATIASKAFSLVTHGTTSMARAVDFTRNLVGHGVLAFTKFTTVHRTFNIQARGKIVTDGEAASTVTIPIDEVPEGGGGTTVIKRPVYVFDD